jgi:uncharacterized membrane protein YdjX (TVP38/TMEM64 family)
MMATTTTLTQDAARMRESPGQYSVPPSTSPGTSVTLRSVGRLLTVLALIGGLILVGRTMSRQLAAITVWVDGLGAAGPAAFVLIYALATVAFVPGSILTLAAGAIFGLAAGTLYTLIAATCGASIAFLAARYVLRGLVERRLATHRKFAAIDHAIAREGLRIVFLLRLSPFFPFNFLNYALGVTSVRFGDYVLACVGMVPGTLLYVYYGKLAGDVARAAGNLTPERGAGYYAVMVLGLLATIAVTAYLTRLARRTLAEVEQAEEAQHG